MCQNQVFNSNQLDFYIKSGFICIANFFDPLHLEFLKLKSKFTLVPYWHQVILKVINQMTVEVLR